MWAAMDGTVSARPVPSKMADGAADHIWDRMTTMPVPVSSTSFAAAQARFHCRELQDNPAPLSSAVVLLRQRWRSRLQVPQGRRGRQRVWSFP